MLERFKQLYVGDNLGEEMRVFNIVHTICAVGMFLMCFVVKNFVDDERTVYITFAIGILFILSIIEGNRTKHIDNIMLFTACIFNFIYMPAIFFWFGRFISVIPIYFIFGIIYSILLLDKKYSIVISILDIVLYMVILGYAYMNNSTTSVGLSDEEILIRYTAAMVGVIVAGALAGAAIRFRYIYYQREYQRAEALKAEAVDAFVAKDMFLINMSHEIRTPMNAIVGYVDLLLDRDVSEHVSDGVYNILNSCNALLSITDELMDLSKSESGEIEIYLSSYDLSELLMEIINMMTVRLTESNLSFFVDINKNIPKNLFGDVSKMRQLLVNILNNAIKYTPSGKIIFRADYTLLDDDRIELVIDVEDTGEGIKKEDIGKLFERYSRNDEASEAHKGIEGTGLGLPICADIIKEMEGEILVESEYGVGSIFTIKVPQRYSSLETIAYVPNPKDFNILIFEKTEEYAVHVKRILDSLEITSDIARTRQDLERLMSVNKYSHVFISNERFEECSRFLNSHLISEKIIAFLDIDDNVYVDKATSVLNRPINIINIIALLKNETNSYVRDVMKKGGFVCPRANILVVDDNYTNLNVASSLIGKYEANVLTAASGKDCLRMIKENDIDMIFLDYMMPEMNGIDTLENIRRIPGSKYTAMPVVALTANVVSGAREMFLEAGFDDFMSKPISIDKLEKMLKKYLPKELIIYKDTQDKN